MSCSPSPDQSRHPQFPNDRLRVWFLTDGTSPVAIKLAQHLLEYGHHVIAVLAPRHFPDDEQRDAQFQAFQAGIDWNSNWAERFKVMRFDVKYGGDDPLLDEYIARLLISICQIDCRLSSKRGRCSPSLRAHRHLALLQH